MFGKVLVSESELTLSGFCYCSQTRPEKYIKTQELEKVENYELSRFEYTELKKAGQSW